MLVWSNALHEILHFQSLNQSMCKHLMCNQKQSITERTKLQGNSDNVKTKRKPSSILGSQMGGKDFWKR